MQSSPTYNSTLNPDRTSTIEYSIINTSNQRPESITGHDTKHYHTDDDHDENSQTHLIPYSHHSEDDLATTPHSPITSDINTVTPHSFPDRTKIPSPTIFTKPEYTKTRDPSSLIPSKTDTHEQSVIESLVTSMIPPPKSTVIVSSNPSN